MKPGGWSLIEGAFVATEHMANAEELQLYFSQEKAGLSVTYDDVSLTPLPKTCDNLILNPTFDEGTTSFWRKLMDVCYSACSPFGTFLLKNRLLPNELILHSGNIPFEYRDRQQRSREN